jgi:hypothetical protein
MGRLATCESPVSTNESNVSSATPVADVQQLRDEIAVLKRRLAVAEAAASLNGTREVTWDYVTCGVLCLMCDGDALCSSSVQMVKPMMLLTKILLMTSTFLAASATLTVHR